MGLRYYESAAHWFLEQRNHRDDAPSPRAHCISLARNSDRLSRRDQPLRRKPATELYILRFYSCYPSIGNPDVWIRNHIFSSCLMGNKFENMYVFYLKISNNYIARHVHLCNFSHNIFMLWYVSNFKQKFRHYSLWLIKVLAIQSILFITFTL